MNEDRKYSILVVDDERYNILVLMDILKPEYTVYAATSGKNAIEMAEKHRPEIILLDIIMPDMDGYEVITALKNSEKTKHIPVIFVTGLCSAEDEEKGLVFGVSDYITKPFSPAIVKLRVQNQMQQILKTQIADESNKAKSRFLANMSHEMRTPMNVIVGLTGLMLEEENIADSLRDNLKKISIAGSTLLGLINDVLDISKIEAGRLELMPVKYEIPSLINDIITLNLIRFENKPIKFILDIKEDLPYNLYGDDLRLKQIINNILSNALKYTHEGTVTLSINCLPDCSLNEDEVWLSIHVSDTGIGIRKEDISRIFTDYGQVDIRTNRAIEGTGLGLAITKRLVEMMDGVITVESEYGKGSVFRFCVRQGFVNDKIIGKETVENLQKHRYTDNKLSARNKIIRPDLSFARVLVVDDMQTNLDVAAGLLGKYKMQVDCVLSGREAIEKIRRAEPVYNAVFMDHMMPEMDGIEAAKAIRSLETDYAKNVPIIALTANAIQGTEEIFYANGFQAFIPKPIDVRQMDGVVREWIPEKG